MPSLVAWLDASADEQRRVREILKLFGDADSRDELGLGGVRDALSDLLFPGTSTLLTRARYLVFVPWCLQLAADRHDGLLGAERLERVLIGTVRDESDNAGLLGMRAGANLVNLPSTVYWTMLRHYGIVLAATRAEVLADRDRPNPVDALDEERRQVVPTLAALPPMPPGFPHQAPGGFALERSEAEWLRERMLRVAHGSLLAHLLVHAPARDSTAPWYDPAAVAADGDARAALDLARRFSGAMHGAQLVYNLLLAVEYERQGLSGVSTPVDRYRQRLAEWGERTRLSDVTGLDVGELLTVVGSSAPAATLAFVRSWMSLLRETDPRRLVDDEHAARLVTTRERMHKGPQARLGRPARLRSWAGASGAGAMTFRWSTVRDIVLDVHDGLAR